MRKKVSVSSKSVKVLNPRYASVEPVVRAGNLRFSPYTPHHPPKGYPLGRASLVLSDIMFNLLSRPLHKLFPLLGTLFVLVSFWLRPTPSSKPSKESLPPGSLP